MRSIIPYLMFAFFAVGVVETSSADLRPSSAYYLGHGGYQQCVQTLDQIDKRIEQISLKIRLMCTQTRECKENKENEIGVGRIDDRTTKRLYAQLRDYRKLALEQGETCMVMLESIES